MPTTWQNKHIQEIYISGEGITWRKLKLLQHTFPNWQIQESQALWAKIQDCYEIAETAMSYENLEMAQYYIFQVMTLLRFVLKKYRNQTYYEMRAKVYKLAQNYKMVEVCLAYVL